MLFLKISLNLNLHEFTLCSSHRERLWAVCLQLLHRNRKHADAAASLLSLKQSDRGTRWKKRLELLQNYPKNILNMLDSYKNFVYIYARADCYVEQLFNYCLGI